MASGEPNGERLECMEVWGGNASTDHSLSTSGLKVWLYSSAHGDGDQGGDVYYVSSCASGRITRLLLADVSGHGATVAGIAAGLRDLMRKNINVISQSGFVRKMNVQFFAGSDPSIFATALVCTFFSPTRSLQFCNAGHPDALLYRTSEQTWRPAEGAAEAVRSEGLADAPLGVSDLSEYSRFTIKLAPNDLVLCVSDAFTEALTPEGKLLGSEGFGKVVAGIDASEPSRIIPELVERVSNLHEGNLQQDDATALLFQATGSSTSLLDNLMAPFRMLRGARDATWLR